MGDLNTRDPDMGAARMSDRDRESTRDRERGAFNFAGEAPHDESITALVRRLADEGSHLAQQQMKLVEAEVRSGISDLKESAGAMAGAAVLGIAGVGVLLMGISFLVAQVMPLWLATLIVAVATLAGAYAMFAAGKKKLESSSLGVERTKRTLERAPSAIAGKDSEVRHDR
jgi:putative superfamily III holin-X